MHLLLCERRGRPFWLMSLLTLLILPAWAKTGLAEEEGLPERVAGVRIPFIANCGRQALLGRPAQAGR